MHALSRRFSEIEFELERCCLQLSALRATLRRQEGGLDELRAQLLSFEGRYIRQVGKLYQQLDQWETKIAALNSPLLALAPESESESLDEQVARAADVSSILVESDNSLDHLDLKALFRELARRIHPDFACDPRDAQQRTRLMAQANDAFRRKDAMALRRMLNGQDPLTAREETTVELLRVKRQIIRIDADIRRVEEETVALQQSELATLQKRTIAAAEQGRDLLAEMAARVKGNIGVAMRRYELDLERRKRGQAAFDPTALLTAEVVRRKATE